MPVGATVSFINKDLNTWSIGRVESHEGRSYVVATEDGRLISCNCIHLRSTNVPFFPKSSRLDVPPTNLAQETNKCISLKPSNTNNKSGQPTTPKPKAKQTHTRPNIILKDSKFPIWRRILKKSSLSIWIPTWLTITHMKPANISIKNIDPTCMPQHPYHQRSNSEPGQGE